MKDRGHKIERMKRYKIENELCLADIFLLQETHRVMNKDKCSSTLKNDTQLEENWKK